MDNKQISRELNTKLWGEGDTSVIDRYVHTNYRDHSPAFFQVKPGAEGMKEQVRQAREAFPDMKIEILNHYAMGDIVCVHWRTTGTNTNSFYGLPATNRKVTVEGISIEKYENGKLVEGWNQADLMGMMQQLGFIPTNPQDFQTTGTRPQQPRAK